MALRIYKFPFVSARQELELARKPCFTFIEKFFQKNESKNQQFLR
jgi:hypothetical protein